MRSIHLLVLQQLGNNIEVRKLHSLGQPGGPRGVHQKRKVLLRLHLSLRIAAHIRRMANTTPMPDPPLRIAPLPQQHNPVLRNARPPRRLPRLRKETHLRNQPLGARVPQLERELVDRVQRVRRGGDAAGPQDAAGQRGGVDIVGRVEGKHVAAAPLPLGFEAAAEVGRGDAELGVGVGPGGLLAVREELLCVWEGLGGAREEEGEDVDFGDWEGGVE